MTNLFPYFIFVNKPVGISSSDVVRYFKYNLPRPIDKIGHIGTLDPFAEGLLMIGVNGAQKANDLIHELAPKTYLAVGLFGSKTNSGDHTGEILATSDLTKNSSKLATISKCELQRILKEKFIGEYFQRPHKVSAVKVKGKRLYEYSRDGEEVEVTPVRRTIFDIEIQRFEYPILEFRVKVSSGTYIRVLFEEIAEYFETLGHLTGLLRESIGDFGLKDSITKDHWPNKALNLEGLKYFTLPDILAFKHKILTDHYARMYKNGVRLRVNQVFPIDELSTLVEGQRFWAYSVENVLLGLFEIRAGELVHLFNFRNS